MRGSQKCFNQTYVIVLPEPTRISTLAHHRYWKLSNPIIQTIEIKQMSSLIYLSRWRPRASYLINLCICTTTSLASYSRKRSSFMYVRFKALFQHRRRQTKVNAIWLDKNMAIVCLSLLSALAHSQNSYAYIYIYIYIYNQAEELMQCICQKWSAKIVPSI